MNDLSPSQVNSRVKVLERPFISPGKCIMCGAVDRPVVDFGANIRNYGAVMFCTLCIAEIGAAVGLVPESQLIDNERVVGVIVNDYLSSHNLKAVTNDYLDLVDTAVSNIANSRHSSVYDLSVQDAENESKNADGPNDSVPAKRSSRSSSSKSRERVTSRTIEDSSKYSVLQGPTSVSDSGSLSDIPDLS